MVAKVLSLIGGCSYFFKVLRNYSMIKKIIVDFETVIKKCAAKHPPMPDTEDTLLIVKNVKALLDAELIDIPGVDEVQLSKLLGDIEHNLVVGLEKK